MGPAAGGGPLLAGAASAEATVVGIVGPPERLDAQAFVAPFEVERVLAGAVQPGASLRIAWEELAASRPVRFRAGDRIAVALEPLPSWSIWRQRLPERDARAIASKGAAFWRDPDPGTLDALERYLELSPEHREAGPGLTALATLVARGAPPLAGAALERLGTAQRLAARLPDAASRALADTLAREERPRALRAGVLDLAGRRGLHGLRPQVVPLAQEGSPLETEALEALARLDGGLPAARVRALLERDAPALRAVAVRYAPAELEPDPAAARVAGDPAPEVRAAAAEALVARRGLGAFDAVAPALFDAVPAVRGAAAQSLGRLGAPAVPRLVPLLDGRTGREATAVLVALAEAGPEGRTALARVAAGHPDPEVRRLAAFVLGRAPAH